jgi:hypothetical protein
MVFNRLRRKLTYKFYYLLDPFYKLLPQKKNQNIFNIFSEERSGTTWLAELLKAGLDAAIFWEPLHPERGLISSKYGGRPYFTDANKDDLKQKLLETLSGKGVNTWTAKMENNIIPFYTASKPFLIKFTRVNRLLPEIFSYFKFTKKPILLLRHPASVFLSQLATFGNPNEGFYWSPKRKSEIVNDPRYLQHKKFIDSQETLLFKEFSTYCMNNYHIYESEFKSDNYIVIFYEDLLVNPMETLGEVILEWRLEKDKIRKIIYKLNKTNTSQGLEKNPELQMAKWDNKLTNIEKEKFQAILNYFRIKIYNMKAGRPIKEFS